MLFLSLKNQLPQSEGMLLRSKCRAVFYAHDIASAVEGLRQSSRLQEIVFRPVASVNELLETSGNKKVYPYEKSFQDAENEPCLILHSSGSTGNSFVSGNIVMAIYRLIMISCQAILSLLP